MIPIETQTHVVVTRARILKIGTAQKDNDTILLSGWEWEIPTNTVIQFDNNTILGYTLTELYDIANKVVKSKIICEVCKGKGGYSYTNRMIDYQVCPSCSGEKYLYLEDSTGLYRNKKSIDPEHKEKMKEIVSNFIRDEDFMFSIRELREAIARKPIDLNMFVPVFWGHDEGLIPTIVRQSIEDLRKENIKK